MFAKAWKLYLEDTFDFIEVEKKGLTLRTEDNSGRSR